MSGLFYKVKVVANLGIDIIIIIRQIVIKKSREIGIVKHLTPFKCG
jgi:hypothetical protein